MNRKILITFVLVVLIGIGVITFNIFKDKTIALTSEECFVISENGVITEYKEICGTEVNIPSKIKGIEVKEIAKYVFSEKGLTKLILPDTLQIIGIGAFEKNEIKELIIPDSVTNIKAYAFYSNKIEKLTIGSSVTNIGIKAFNDNQMEKDSFIYMRTEKGIKDNVIIGYAGKERENVVLPEGTKTLYLSSLAECNIKNITLNNELERIESKSLEDNNLNSITIPGSVNLIGKDALGNNENLTEIKIEGKKSFEDFNQFDTTGLEQVNIVF